MNARVSFISSGKEYYAEAWFDEECHVYDCTECYTFDDEMNSVDVDWEDYKYEIECEVERIYDDHKGMLETYRTLQYQFA